jgi:hypothetical protein
MKQSELPSLSPAQRWMNAKARKEQLETRIGFKAYAVGPGQDIPSPAMALAADAMERLQLLEQEEKEAYAAYQATLQPRRP